MDSAFVIARGIVLTVVAFGLMIFVHELGHFLAAKLIGVRVDRFSFGFGPKIVGHQWGKTDYWVSAIPLGGYVKMAGGDEGEEATGATDEFVSKSPGQRTLVLVAGPLFSVLFGIPLAMAMLVIGRQTPASQVSYVAVGSPAWDAGVEYGDRIKSLSGHAIASFEEVKQAVHECAFGESLDLVVERDGRELTLRVTRPKASLLGVDCRFTYTRIQEVEPNMPAAAAGIRKGDKVLAVNGHPLRDWFDFRRYVLASPDRPVELAIERDGKASTVKITPRAVDAPDPGFTMRLPAEVGFVRQGFPADGKLRIGDRITAVNGTPVAGWWDVEDAAAAGPGTVTFRIERRPDAGAVRLPMGDPSQLAEAVAAARKTLQREPLTVEVPRGDGVFLTNTVGIAPVPAYEIVSIHRQADPPLQVGDLIVKAGAIDLTEAIPEWALYRPLDDMLGILGSMRREVVRRGSWGVLRPELTWSAIGWYVGPSETQVATTLSPGTRKVGQLGVVPTANEVLYKNGLFGSFVPAIDRTINISTFAFTVIARLFQRDVPLGDLMGPVGIAQVTYLSATRGWSDLFWLVHLITVNIGVFNLLPMPPLDGGRIVLLAYEKVRGKRPSRKLQEAVILAGFGLIVAIFLVATFNDVVRLFS